jgi:hypothetical protein
MKLEIELFSVKTCDSNAVDNMYEPLCESASSTHLSALPIEMALYRDSYVS